MYRTRFGTVIMGTVDSEMVVGDDTFGINP
jgi:hypothetical protein